ncbi:MAG: Ppx/GppA family phosphatase [Burkholderiales bacterium]|nr:Ppx/GppA family phosphatase [Burkholderiales bacterium]
MNNWPQVAAVDLGSNSFRLEIGRAERGHIYVQDSLRSNVRLAAGLGADKLLDDAAWERGLEALALFGQRLAGFRAAHVRAVATNTLRVARNARQFIEAAERVLGFPIEVIAGREEARLIFSGVAHSVPANEDRRLVVDIGGGSTEVSVGTGFEPELMESLYVGAINSTLGHFPGGYIDDFTLKQAELAARREVQVIADAVRRSGWTAAIASSGTARTIARLLAENNGGDGTITVAGMRWLRKRLLAAGNIDGIRLGGLKPERALNLPGGFAILAAVFAEFGIERMQVSDNSLRLGVLYDLVNRLSLPEAAHDKREATVAQFAARYRVDAGQAERIAGLAVRLARGCLPALTEMPAECPRFIDWAARLHEVGLTIAHNGYHRHSAYIVANADMPGFSRDEQRRLSFLILGHAGKLPKLTREAMPRAWWVAVACLRLAALVHRSRQALDPPPLDLALEGRRLRLTVDDAWLQAYPLTAYSLEQEVRAWQDLGESRPFHFDVVRPVALAA